MGTHLEPAAGSGVQPAVRLRNEDCQPEDQHAPVILVVGHAHGLHLLCSHQLRGAAVAQVAQMQGAFQHSMRDPAGLWPVLVVGNGSHMHPFSLQLYQG